MLLVPLKLSIALRVTAAAVLVRVVPLFLKFEGSQVSIILKEREQANGEFAPHKNWQRECP